MIIDEISNQISYIDSNKNILEPSKSQEKHTLNVKVKMEEKDVIKVLERIIEFRKIWEHPTEKLEKTLDNLKKGKSINSSAQKTR